METKSLNQLKKHLKLCKKCQLAKNYRMMCEYIRHYATQDYVRQKEQPVSPYILDRIQSNPWTESISDTEDGVDQKFIQQKLALLEPIDRKIIELYYWEGKTLRGIASFLGFKSDNSIRKHLKKSYELLKQSLITTVTSAKSSFATNYLNAHQKTEERKNLL